MDSLINNGGSGGYLSLYYGDQFINRINAVLRVVWLQHDLLGNSFVEQILVTVEDVLMLLFTEPVFRARPCIFFTILLVAFARGFIPLYFKKSNFETYL